MPIGFAESTHVSNAIIDVIAPFLKKLHNFGEIRQENLNDLFVKLVQKLKNKQAHFYA